MLLAVAPDGRHRALEVAREARGDADVARAVTRDEALRERGEAAALERAAWLLREEFGADATVRTADEAPDHAVRQSRPGRPAIDVQE